MKYVALKDVCKINMGQSPNSSSYNDNSEGIPFFQGNADFGEKYPVNRIWCNAPTKIAQPEDILISVRAPIGALNYAKEECCIGRGLAAITPDRSKVSLEFIYWLLKGKNAELNSKGTGSTFKAISRKVLEETLVPVIDFEKQHKYAEILEKTYSVIQNRKEELQHLDKLIKSRFVEMFGNPIYNTNNLPVKYLSDLGEWASGGTPSRTVIEYFEGDINWYSAGELNTLYLDGSVEKITQEAIKQSSAKLFKKGSMLVGMYDTAAFKMGILKENSASNQACACITPNDEVNIIWLYYELQLMKEYFLSQRRGVRQKNLNLGMIKGFEVPVADKRMQDEFADFVNQIDKSKFEG